MEDTALVLCECCRYLRVERRTYSTKYSCRHPENCETEHDWCNIWSLPRKHPKIINRNNDCKWFGSSGR